MVVSGRVVVLDDACREAAGRASVHLQRNRRVRHGEKSELEDLLRSHHSGRARPREPGTPQDARRRPAEGDGRSDPARGVSRSGPKSGHPSAAHGDHDGQVVAGRLPSEVPLPGRLGDPAGEGDAQGQALGAVRQHPPRLRDDLRRAGPDRVPVGAGFVVGDRHGRARKQVLSRQRADDEFRVAGRQHRRHRVRARRRPRVRPRARLHPRAPIAHRAPQVERRGGLCAVQRAAEQLEQGGHRLEHLAEVFRTGINATMFDRHSIMLYQFPAELFLDHVATPANTRLSKKDESFIAQVYPRHR